AVIVRVVRGGARVELVQGLDDEAVGSEYANPIAVAGMEFDATAGPLHPIQIALRPEQPVLRLAFLFGDAEGCQHAVRQEDEPAVRAEQSRRLADPAFGITPHAR